MAATIPTTARANRATTSDHDLVARSLAVDQALSLLRRAVAECGWTLDALQAEMRKNKAYIHRVLHGDKPLTLTFLIALPDEVEARYAHLRAEHFGLIVVSASASREQAERDLVSGLFGLLRAQLPARADRFAKADLVSKTVKTA
jgi:hypothetical protein